MLVRRGLLATIVGASAALSLSSQAKAQRRTILRGALVHNTDYDCVVPNGVYGASVNCTFAHTEYDSHGFFDKERKDRFVVPPGIEWVTLSAGVVYEHNETGMRQGVIKKNGKFWPGVPCFSVPANKGTTTDFTTASPPTRVDAGDYFTWELLQWHVNSEGQFGEGLAARGTGTWFSIEAVGDIV